jgi:hypothetical protein
LTSRIAARAAREAFVYEPPAEPDASAMRLEDVDPVARLRSALRELSANLPPGEAVSSTAWVTASATDFADAVFLLNLLARVEGQSSAGIEVDGVALKPEIVDADPEAWRDLDPAAAIEALVRLGVLARVSGKGVHTEIRLRRVPGGGIPNG